MEISIYNGFKVEEPKKPKKNKKKIIKISAIILLSAIIIGIIVAYSVNENVREYMDYNIFSKKVEEKNTKSISLGEDKNSYVYAYDNNICILNNNILHVYNSSGSEQFQLEIEVTNPIFEARNKYLVIAEKGGKKLYYINGRSIIWQTDVDGEITRVKINKNGYVSIIISQNTYKTVVITYSPQGKGKEMFKKFLSNSYAIDTDISNDNKYLAIAEENTDGTVIQSSIEIISIEKLETDTENATIYHKSTDTNQMITAIKYSDSNALVAMYDNCINVIKEGEERLLTKFEADSLFANINPNQSAIEARQETAKDLDVFTKINIFSTVNSGQNHYNIKAIPKDLIANSNNIAINTGMEAYFITTNGWLRKKYVGRQEIKSIVLGEDIAGIIYNNKVNIVKL